eukprot:6718393-Prymnesium_polylepis.1
MCIRDSFQSQHFRVGTLVRGRRLGHNGADRAHEPIDGFPRSVGHDAALQAWLRSPPQLPY